MKFYYFGDDEAFFRALQGEFRKHTRTVIEFTRYSESKEAQIQSFFLKVFKDHPACVFIDFSKNTPDYLHLARILSRTKMEHQMVMVGLVDYLSPPEILTESIATGVTYSYIKSADIFDVVYDVTRIIAPGECSNHGFAVASFEEVWEVGVPCKIGYVDQIGLHIETDMSLSAGDKIKINHNWLEKRVVPSRDVFVKEVSNANLFFQYKKSADLEFQFVDEFTPPEGIDESKIIEKQNEREETIAYHKKQLKKWLDENQSRSQQKIAKMLVVDREFRFYQDQPRTDKNQYTIRCLPSFSDIADELNRHSPQVVAFEIEKIEGENVNTENKNTIEVLSRMVQILTTKLTELKPIIIVFNSELDSWAMQARLQYQQVMTYPGELSVEVLAKMADMLQKRLNVSSVPTLKKRVFINKSLPASVAEVVMDIKVLKISESDLTFTCNTTLQPGMNLHVRKPMDMYISVNSGKASGKVTEYFGLIHSIGEKQKKELRKYVNSVFFRDSEAQKLSELEEFKKLNEQKLQEKSDEAAKETPPDGKVQDQS